MKAESMDNRHGNKETGRLGEEAAAAFLLANGYRILDRNFRCKGGEVDIIARAPEDGCLVFAEVKARSGMGYGLPQQAVNAFKQRQISKAALTWLAKNRLHDRDGRFDVIAVFWRMTVITGLNILRTPLIWRINAR